MILYKYISIPKGFCLISKVSFVVSKTHYFLCLYNKLSILSCQSYTNLLENNSRYLVSVHVVAVNLEQINYVKLVNKFKTLNFFLKQKYKIIE